jgi:hypothetical protein
MKGANEVTEQKGKADFHLTNMLRIGQQLLEAGTFRNSDECIHLRNNLAIEYNAFAKAVSDQMESETN